MRQARWLCVTLIVGVFGLVTSTQTMAQTTTTDIRTFEVISVDGNKLVARTVNGTQEYTVPEDFRFDVDGKQVSVHELKPGMRGTATITTITTVKPVHVTEIRNGEVMQVAGSSVIVRGESGIRSFTQGEVDKRGVKIYKDGKPIQLSDLRTGDRLTATIVTEGPPAVMTQRQVQAVLAGQPPPPAEPAQPPPAAPPPAPAPGAAGTTGTAPATPTPLPAELPKTASPLPIVGLIGAVALAVGGILAAVRRRRA